MSSPEVTLVVALFGVALGAFAGGVVGMGFPVIAVPALALGYGLETAVIVSAIPTLAIDLANLYRTRSERHDVGGLIVFGSVAASGTLAGTLVRASMNERILVGVLTATVALYLISEALPKIDLRSLARRTATGAVAGSAAGVLQATVGVSGPIVGMYFLNRTQSRSSFIFHITAVFALMGIVRITTLASIGAFTANKVWASLGLAVIAVALRTVGYGMGERLDRDTFRKMVLVVLGCSLVPLLLQTF